jgi:GntR family transcriptional regulator
MFGRWFIRMTAHTADAFLPRWKLDRKNGVPLHVQIERRLQELILRPPYSTGAFLPDEVTLASRLGVSRGTVRESILNLVHRGLLERRKGAGTRVVQSGLVAWASLTGEMRRKGIDVESFVLEISEEAARDKIADALQVAAGTPVKCLDQVRGWEDRPVLQSRSWFHPRLKLSGKEDFRRPLYGLLKEEAGAIADHAREEFLAVTADEGLARRLKIKKGTPLLLRRRTSFDAKGRPIDYAEIHYDTGDVSLTLTSRWQPVE